MKVTRLGHATVLVETGSMRILMDPVLLDPFENGMVVSCPKRVIDLAARYRREGAVYGIEVIFPDDGASAAEPRERWTLDFRTSPLQVSRGLDPRANVVHRIAASALTGWIQRRLGWFTVRASSRRYSTLCSISRHESSVRVEASPLPDLLMHFMIYEAADSEDAAKQRIDHEISQLRAVRG